MPNAPNSTANCVRARHTSRSSGPLTAGALVLAGGPTRRHAPSPARSQLSPDAIEAADASPASGGFFHWELSSPTVFAAKRPRATSLRPASPPSSATRLGTSPSPTPGSSPRSIRSTAPMASRTPSPGRRDTLPPHPPMRSGGWTTPLQEHVQLDRRSGPPFGDRVTTRPMRTGRVTSRTISRWRARPRFVRVVEGPPRRLD